MFTRRRFIGGSLGLGAGAMLGLEELGCGSSASANEWRVGAFLSLTGQNSEFGDKTKKGIDLAVEEINKAPPKGKPLKILYEDDKSNAQEANNKVLQLIDRDKVVALLGEVASGISKPCGITANNKKVPMISPSSTNPDVTQTGPYVFRVCFIDDFQGQMAAEFIVKTLKKKKIGLFFAVDNLYSSGLATEFKKALGGLGGEIVLEKSFPDKETNFTTYIQEMKAKGPDIIYAPIYYSQMTPMAKQAKAEGIKGEMFVGGDGWSGDEELLKELEGGYFTDHYAPDIPWEKSRKFVEAYKAKYNAPPDSLAAMGYDAAGVLAAAIAKASGDTRDAIRDAIAATKDYEGATGKITLDANRNAIKPAVIVQIKGGATTYVAVVGPGSEAMTGGKPAAAPSASATAEASAPAPSASASASPSASASASPGTSASAAPGASASAAPKK